MSMDNGWIGFTFTLPFAMPSNCTACNCSNNSNQGYALVRYPHDESLKQKWIAAVGRGKNWSPSSSQKLCEDRKNCPRNSFIAQLPLNEQSSRSKQIKNVPRNHCDHTYSKSNKRKLLTLLTINNISNGKTYLRKKRGYLIQHQCGCVQTYKPLTKEDIQTIAKSQEIVEQIDEMQSMDENKDLLRSIIDENEQLQNKMKGTMEVVVKIDKTEEIDIKDENKDLLRSIIDENEQLQNSMKGTVEDVVKVEKTEEIDIKDENNDILRSIIDENEQLQNKIKGTVEEVVKVDKKTEEIDVKNRKVYEENYELKQQIKILNERVQLMQKNVGSESMDSFKNWAERNY
ncbi:uncharacterized protein [Temnothorax nylanderi]|uniref:uncharacterized protein isoform X2 n=1 Tax=Temnothorax nylanderi TaxID=102681 RepID=UPI003A884268